MKRPLAVPSLFPAARQRPFTRYAIAVAAVLFVTLLKVRVDWIGRDAPGAVYLGAVMFAAWFGGVGPGLVAVGVSFFFGAYIFTDPYDSLAIASADESARLLIAGAEGTLIALLGGALRKSNDDLHRQMRERALAEEALRCANDQVVHAQKMRAVGEFASGVAHDFNNMVTVVLMCVELLEKKLPHDHPTRIEVREIRGAIERAAELAKQLLTFARRREVKLAPVDVHAMLGRIEPILARVVGAWVRIERLLDATRTHVLADVVQLEQAIVNLASNGRDAMPAGGTIVIATADASEAYCRAHARRPGPHLEILVTDSGTGMDEETKARVFEPFFTTKPVGEGTGLGLSMVFGIVEGMGGSILVETALGKGTTFRLLLPVNPGA